jgi:catechol 2,3-dioxygenase
MKDGDTPQAAYGIPPREFRLPDATHVGAVHLQVSDLQRSVAYYEQVIGLRTYTATTDTVALGPEGVHRPLVWLQTRSGVVPARRGAFGLYHFAILLPERVELGRIEVYADRPRNSWQRRGRELAMTTDPLNIDSLIAAGGGKTWDGAPAGTKMGHVHLHVGDLDAAEAFYHRGLGFDKTVWSYPGALFLAAGGYHHHLGTNTWSPGPSPGENQARLLQWELIVPDEEGASAVARSLTAIGYKAEPHADGVIAADPWGTRVRIRTSAE